MRSSASRRSNLPLAVLPCRPTAVDVDKLAGNAGSAVLPPGARGCCISTRGNFLEVNLPVQGKRLAGVATAGCECVVRKVLTDCIDCNYGLLVGIFG